MMMQTMVWENFKRLADQQTVYFKKGASVKATYLYLVFIATATVLFYYEINAEDATAIEDFEQNIQPTAKDAT